MKPSASRVIAGTLSNVPRPAGLTPAALRPSSAGTLSGSSSAATSTSSALSCQSARQSASSGPNSIERAIPPAMKVLHRPNTTLRRVSLVILCNTAGAATTTMRKPSPSTKRVASNQAKSCIDAPSRLAPPRIASPPVSSRRSPQRRTRRPAAMPPNTPTNGKADMIQLSAARSPPKLRCSDGRAMVALPTCRAAAMPAKITLATASHRGLAWGCGRAGVDGLSIVASGHGVAPGKVARRSARILIAQVNLR